MISKEKLLKKILKGKLNVIQAYSLVMSNYDNKLLNDFVYELHEEIFRYFDEEIILSLSESDIREIYSEVEKINKKISDKIEIEKIRCNEEEFEIIRFLCLEVDNLFFIRNAYGFLNKEDSDFRDIVDLNKLVFNYLSNENADFLYIILERLDCVRNFPLLIELLYRLDILSIKFNDNKRVCLDYFNNVSKPKPEKVQPETLSSIITHDEAETLVSGIKTQYKNIKGKRLKLLLIVLQELELLPKERIASKFHTLCKKEFDWDIASYNAMMMYNFNPETDTDIINGMKQYIKKSLNTK